MSVERIYQIAEWIVMYVNSVDAPTVDNLTGKIENKNI
jgi:hypothetical protein